MFDDSVSAPFAGDDNKIVRGNLSVGLEVVAHREELRRECQRGQVIFLWFRALNN
jgi:hypothetical protein